MSIEYYVQGFSDGERDGVGVAEALAAFGDALSPAEGGRYRLAYDEVHVCEMSVDLQAGRAAHFCIFRPCDHSGLFNGLFRLLERGPYVLYAPGGVAPVAVGKDLAADLPDGMIEALGAPVRAETPEDILHILFGT